MIKLKKTRSEKMDETRRTLFNAAIEVVGEVGYAAASIKQITSLASVANGTFYNYFDDRQDLFDQLLPALGEKMLVHIRAQLDDSLSGLAREKQRLASYFDFCKRTPGFLRILNEAEVFAPKAYRQHVYQFYLNYLGALERSVQQGEIREYAGEDLAPIVFMLMGIRSYMTMLFQYNYISKDKVSVERLINVYSKLLSEGLFNK